MRITLYVDDQVVPITSETTQRKYKSDAFEAIHTSATAQQKVGAIDHVTMSKFDASCLTTLISLKPNQIKRIRQGAHGSKQPSGMPLKLLSVFKKHGREVMA